MLVRPLLRRRQQLSFDFDFDFANDGMTALQLFVRRSENRQAIVLAGAVFLWRLMRVARERLEVVRASHP